jgi:hypothetical protein
VSPWLLSKDNADFSKWNYYLCRRADFTGKLWPSNRASLYEQGLTVDEAMHQTYPEWRPR